MPITQNVEPQVEHTFQHLADQVATTTPCPKCVGWTQFRRSAVRTAPLLGAVAAMAATFTLLLAGQPATAGPCAVIAGVLAAIWATLMKDWKEQQK